MNSNPKPCPSCGSWDPIPNPVEQFPADILTALVELGLVVSFVYGPAEGIGVCWSVDLLNTATGAEFDRPFGADSFEQAQRIAWAERGAVLD